MGSRASRRASIVEARVSNGLAITNLRLNVAATGNDIVDEVTLTVEPGRVLGLVGESGSGKTTVGDLIVRPLLIAGSSREE
ncbi:MAG: ATP-binding cassette domain-containing protein, partial [Actinobacteria bacterium]|nr:ATP-binding cassette domain-containing protein [Actinomycetota bacterium]